MRIIDKIRAMPNVRDVWQDSDGMWLTYHDGWVSSRTECTREHEYTWTDLLKATRDAEYRPEAVNL